MDKLTLLIEIQSMMEEYGISAMEEDSICEILELLKTKRKDEALKIHYTLTAKAQIIVDFILQNLIVILEK